MCARPSLADAVPSLVVRTPSVRRTLEAPGTHGTIGEVWCRSPGTEGSSWGGGVGRPSRVVGVRVRPRGLHPRVSKVTGRVIARSPPKNKNKILSSGSRIEVTDRTQCAGGDLVSDTGHPILHERPVFPVHGKRPPPPYPPGPGTRVVSPTDPSYRTGGIFCSFSPTFVRVSYKGRRQKRDVYTRDTYLWEEVPDSSRTRGQ